LLQKYGKFTTPPKENHYFFQIHRMSPYKRHTEMSDTLENPSDAFEKPSNAFESVSNALDTLNNAVLASLW